MSAIKEIYDVSKDVVALKQKRNVIKRPSKSADVKSTTPPSPSEQYLMN